MPFEDFVVCDSDMHVLEPADLWQRYIADEFKHAAPVGMTELKRDLRVKIKSQVLLKTREKLERLEARVAELEARFPAPPPAH